MDLSDASVAETSTKNINNSFTVRGMWGYLLWPSTLAPRGGGTANLLLPTELWGTPQRGLMVLGVALVAVCRGSLGAALRGWLAAGWSCKGTRRWWLLQVITPFRKLILCAENRKEMEDWISALKSVQKWEIHEVMWAGGCAGASLQGSTPQEWGVPLAAGQELLPLAQPHGEDRSREWGLGDSGWLGGRECQWGVPGD